MKCFLTLAIAMPFFFPFSISANVFEIAFAEPIECPDVNGEVTMCARFQASQGIDPTSFNLDLTDPDGNFVGSFAGSDLISTTTFSGFVVCFTFYPSALNKSKNNWWHGHWTAATTDMTTLEVDQYFIVDGPDLLNVRLFEFAGPVQVEKGSIKINNICGAHPGTGVGTLPCNTCPALTCGFNQGSLLLFGPVNITGEIRIENTALCNNVVLNHVTVGGKIIISDNNLQSVFSLTNSELPAGAQIIVENTTTLEPINVRHSNFDSGSQMTFSNLCIEENIEVTNVDLSSGSKFEISDSYIGSGIDLVDMPLFGGSDFLLTNNCLIGQIIIFDTSISDSNFGIDNCNINATIFIENTELSSKSAIRIEDTETFGFGFGSGIVLDGANLLNGGEFKVLNCELNQGIEIDNSIIDSKKLEFKNIEVNCFIRYVAATIIDKDQVFNNDINEPCPGDFTGTFKMVPEVNLEGYETPQPQLQAQPNPFSNHLSIILQLPHDETATIELLAPDGRLSATLYKGPIEAGISHTLKFDGGNLPAGVYYLTLLTGKGDLIHQKLVLSK